MNVKLVTDIPGRLRVRLALSELCPGDLGHLASQIAESYDVIDVSFSLLTGSLLVIYEKNDRVRRELLDRIQNFKPGAPRLLLKKAPNLGEDRVVAKESPKALNQVMGGVMKLVLNSSTFKEKGLTSAVGTLKNLDASIRCLSGGKHGLFCVFFH
ncbi:MAG: hypothetical protein LBE27_04685 [Deltaproteobacteria bacterium]|nr:hypothetical protein [Deltaproteobacteria bacterium]